MRRLAAIACAAVVCAAGASAGVAAGAGSAVGVAHATRRVVARASSRRAGTHAVKRVACSRRRHGRTAQGCHPVWRMTAKRLHVAKIAARAPAAPGTATTSTGPTTSPAAGPGTSTTPATTTTPLVSSTLGVEAHDGADGFYLQFSHAPSAPAGQLTIFFHNRDVSDHNLWIEGSDGVAQRISDTVGEDLGGSQTVAVAAGSYVLFCSLPGHEKMRATLTVTL
jgi:plastocyanin